MLEFSSLLPDTTGIGSSGLTIGGCDLSELAHRYGTPLYVYDEATLRSSCQSTLRAFAGMRTRVSFAAKACSTIGILKVLQDEGMHLDVVSSGELMAARLAGFKGSQIHLHGNYKTDTELQEAVTWGLHAVVVDSAHELDRLEIICRRLALPVSVMLRITLAEEAQTHPHIQTSGPRSKFGFQHGSRDEAHALYRVLASESLQFLGLHTHLGSQISDVEIYRRAADLLISFAQSIERHGLATREISVGGGWAVPYRRGDVGLGAASVASVLASCFAPHPELSAAVEPGRALAARAGVALYRVGSIKSFGDHRIIAVDGGMGDNPRPALYGARYDALVVQRPDAKVLPPADIVGRYCESGDVIATRVSLPDVQAGDLICVPVSGAYHLAMESAYNRIPPPAVILVRAGQSRMLVRRGNNGDLFTRESHEDTPYT